MPLDTRYAVGININDYFVDKDTGLPLSGGTIEFFKDSARNVGKTVYQLTGSPPNYTYTPLVNPITLSSVGTVNNGMGQNVAIYYYPYDEEGNLDLYYIVVKNSAGVPQLVREGWPNVAASSSPVGSISGGTDNQISNSQFVDILFEEADGVNLPIPGAVSNMEFEIAPGWSLIVSSSGAASIDVGRLSIQGSLNVNTNPPYALTVLPNGAAISSIKLRQRMYSNPDIWANSFLGAFMLIASLDSLPHTIEMTYAPSVAPSPQTVILASTGASGYVSAANVIAINPGVNTDVPPAGYIDIDILLPKTGYIAISSIQVLPVADISSVQAYKQDTVNRQEDHLFHYYNPLIQQVPVPCIVHGWDFKMNPAQFGSTVAMGVVASQYLWDQLIGWQNVNSSITASRSSPRALNIARHFTNQFALIQYFNGPDLRTLLANDFSVVIKALTDIGGGASGTVSFWATTDATLPNTAATLSLINTIDANGKPSTFHGSWTEIPRNYRGDGRFTIPMGTQMSEISLEGWNKTLRATDATYSYGAIVVGFESATSSNVTFDSISVTPGLLARPFSPLTYNETLTQMQYYYEKSYAADVSAGAVTGVNALVRLQTLYNISPGSDVMPSSFSVEFRNIKRAAANVIIYTPSGLINNVRLLRGATPVSTIPISNWDLNSGTYAASFYANNSTPLDIGGITSPAIDFQYIADARFGIVL